MMGIDGEEGWGEWGERGRGHGDGDDGGMMMVSDGK